MSGLVRSILTAVFTLQDAQRNGQVMSATYETARVFIVDDDPQVLQTARGILEGRGLSVECYLSAEDFLEHAPPDDVVGCLVTDLNMPGMSGEALLQRVALTHPGLAVVVITGMADVAVAVRIMEGGAVTLLQKPYTAQAFVTAVQKALERSQAKWQSLRMHSSVQQRLDSLTENERQVMQLMVQGLPNKRIVLELGLSARTVDRRRAAVLQKMQVNSATELAALISRAHVNS